MIRTAAIPSLPQVTEAEIVAARLRAMAADLVRQAEALEATAPKRPTQPKRKRRSLIELAKEDVCAR
jgi:hypothetical protein